MIVTSSAANLFTLFFGLFTTGFLFQFKEFTGLGLSPDNLLASYLGSEEFKFVEFHLRKTAGTALIHACLPAVYFLGYWFVSVSTDRAFPSFSAFLAAHDPYYSAVLTLSCLLPLTLALYIAFWSMDGWSNHPMVKKILPYASNGLWKDVVKDVDTEFRRIDKFVIRANPVVRIVVTDNWILQVGQWPWQFQLAHQSDVSLSLLDSEHHQISTEGHAGGAQFLKILVQNRKPNIESFSIRVNSLEYQNLQDKIRGPISNVRNLQIFKTVGERFVEVFREEVEKNPIVTVEEELENCIGCMVNVANVKLVRRCETEGVPDACVNCYCRPMWCLDCMGKWFASRQNQTATETWLGSKCPCPICRSKFCMMDVSLIDMQGH